MPEKQTSLVHAASHSVAEAQAGLVRTMRVMMDASQGALGTWEGSQFSVLAGALSGAIAAVVPMLILVMAGVWSAANAMAGAAAAFFGAILLGTVAGAATSRERLAQLSKLVAESQALTKDAVSQATRLAELRSALESQRRHQGSRVLASELKALQAPAMTQANDGDSLADADSATTVGR